MATKDAEALAALLSQRYFLLGSVLASTFFQRDLEDHTRWIRKPILGPRDRRIYSDSDRRLDFSFSFVPQAIKNSFKKDKEGKVMAKVARLMTVADIYSFLA